MLLLVLMAGLAGWCSHEYWMRLGDDVEDLSKRYWRWLLQGLFFPWVIWCLFNIGWGSSMPALVPQIVDAQRDSRPWFWLWVRWGFVGAILIGIYWTALTYAWLLGRIITQAQDRKEIWLNIALFGFFSGSIAAVL